MKLSFNYFLDIAFFREILPKLLGGFGCHRHEWVNPFMLMAPKNGLTTLVKTVSKTMFWEIF